MIKISTIGLACVIAALVFWKTTLSQPSLTDPSARAGEALASGQIAIPPNLPEADPGGAY